MVETVKVRVIDNQRMVIELGCHRQPDIELFGLGKKKPLLEDLLRMRIRGEVRDA